MVSSNSAAPSVEYFLPKNKNDPNFKDNVFYFRLGAYDATHEPESSSSDAPTGLYCYSPDHYTLKSTGKLYETVSGPAQIIVDEGDYVYTNTDGDLTIDVGEGVLLKAKETVDIIANGTSADGEESFLIDAGENNNIRFIQKHYEDTTDNFSSSTTKGDEFKFVLGAALTGLVGKSHNVNLSLDVKMSTLSFSTKLSAAVDGKALAFTLGRSAYTFIISRQLSTYVGTFERTFLEEEFLIGKFCFNSTEFEQMIDRSELEKLNFDYCEASIDSSVVDVESHLLQSM